MALKDILVHLDDTKLSPARLEMAINYAKKHQAHLTGLYVTSRPFNALHQDIPEQATVKTQALFKKITTKEGISATWLYVQPTMEHISVPEVVTRHAYYADIVIVGQSAPDSQSQSAFPSLPEQLALWAGCPVLVVPYVGTFTTAGERVLVAWRGGRESARAVNDAIPILKKAQHVKILSVDNLEDKHNSSNEKICNHLKHHGIKATADRIIAKGLNIGDILLNQASDEGADLLVMGVYSPTHAGMVVTGPVGKYLLKHMTVPILISH